MTHAHRQTPNASSLARLVLATAAMIVAGPALASSFGMGSICATYDPPKKALTISVSTKCLSGSLRYAGHNVTGNLDQTRASLTVDGGFNYEPLTQQAVTADCGGARSHKLTFENVARRRFTVIDNGQFRGVFDFTGRETKLCLGGALQRRAALVNEFNPAMQKFVANKLPVTRARSIQTIIGPLVEDLAVRTEGFGALNVDIQRLPPTKYIKGARAGATIEGHGLLDDSVSGLRYRATFRADGEMWKLIAISREQMCARGKMAGQWTDKGCS